MLGIHSPTLIPVENNYVQRILKIMDYIQETICTQAYYNFILKLILPVPNTAVEVDGRSTGEL